MLIGISIIGCTKSDPGAALVSGEIGKGLTFTYWLPRPENRTSSTLEDIGSLRIYKYLEQETGVHIEFIYPWRSNELADLVARVESADLPDMIEWNWLSSYPGGPDQAISDGTIIELGGMLRQYAPNLSSMLIEDQELAKLLSSEEGRFYGFPYVKPEENSRAVVGPVFRERWLEATGQTIPKTIDEWQNVLWAFKEYDFGTMGKEAEYPFYMISFKPFGSDGATIPFLFESNIFAGAYGTSFSFYTSGEDIRFGPTEPAYEHMLLTLAGWYADGLIDPNIGQMDRAPGSRIIQALGKAGSTVMDLANIPFLAPLGLVPAPPPSLTQGTGIGTMLEPRYGGSRTVAISTACNSPAEAMQWLDIGHGEAGHLVYNYGIPQETYSLKRGTPVLTDEIIADFVAKGRKGSFRDTVLFATSRGVAGGPYLLNADLFSLYADTAFSSGSISS